VKIRAVAYVWISVGAVLGANARYLVAVWAAERISAAFPYGTLAINVTGSFLLGLFLGLLAERAPADPTLRLLLAVGFCGSYTTFSTFSFETIDLLRGGQWAAAGGYIVGSILLGLAGVLGGLAVSRAV
jgi:CrcB protein